MVQLAIPTAVAAFLMLVAFVFAIVGVASTEKGWYSCNFNIYEPNPGANISVSVDIGTLKLTAAGASQDLEDGNGCDADTGGSVAIAFSVIAMVAALVSLVCGGARAVQFGPPILDLVAAGFAGATAVCEFICWLTFVSVWSGECDGQSEYDPTDGGGFSFNGCAPDYAWALALISFLFAIAAAIVFVVKRPAGGTDGGTPK